ncbi:unnamed protein product [Trifolium pratense]|uniref:Uncharacterized protein n=1 Tax=Trifolium pratense TaxID=57577 RepID=A0ACB0KB53_TRIPR|nr:unnamed protein product [Trifolium pratense]
MLELRSGARRSKRLGQSLLRTELAGELEVEEELVLMQASKLLLSFSFSATFLLKFINSLTSNLSFSLLQFPPFPLHTKFGIAS